MRLSLQQRPQSRKVHVVRGSGGLDVTDATIRAVQQAHSKGREVSLNSDGRLVVGDAKKYPLCNSACRLKVKTLRAKAFEYAANTGKSVSNYIAELDKLTATLERGQRGELILWPTPPWRTI